MKKKIVLYLLFVNIFITSSVENVIKDIQFINENYSEKLYIIDYEDSNKNGYYLIKSQRSLSSTNRKYFSVEDHTVIPFNGKVSSEKILDYKIWLNKKQLSDKIAKKILIVLMSVMGPGFLTFGAISVPMLYFGYNITLSSNMMMLFEIWGYMALLAFGYVFAIGSGLALIAFIASLISYCSMPSYYKNNIINSKVEIIYALNNEEIKFEENEKKAPGVKIFEWMFKIR